MKARRIARRAYLSARHPGLGAALERTDERERRRADLATQARRWYRRSARPVLVAVIAAPDAAAGRPGARRDSVGATWRAARRTTAGRLTRVLVVPNVGAARAAVRLGEDLVLLRAGALPR